MKLKNASIGNLWPFRKERKTIKVSDNECDVVLYCKSPRLENIIPALAAIPLVMGFLLSAAVAFAQGKPPVKGLQPGQKVPEVSITNIINYKSSTAKLSDFKGKLLILDFWATWCSPCIAMIPKMDSLQKVFEGKIQFLPVTYQSEKEVLPFMAKLQKYGKKKSAMPEVLADKVLHQLFPHTTLPHYVWIDANGIVKAITGFEEISGENIREALENEFSASVKKDVSVPYKPDKSLAENQPLGLSGIIGQSLLIPYLEGAVPGYTISKEEASGKKILARNLSILNLYGLAYGEGKRLYGSNRLDMQVKDPGKLTSSATGPDYLNWQQGGNAFCYEHIAPRGMESRAFKMMQEDLGRYFPQYSASLQKQLRPCLVLKRTGTEDKLKSSGGSPEVNMNRFGAALRNAYLNQLTSRLEFQWLSRHPLPLINGTGYTGKVDLSIEADLSNVASLNTALERYGLRLEEEKREIEVLVIKESN